MKERPMHDAPYHTLRRHGEQLILTHRKREASTMAGMRDYNDIEIDLVRKSFCGRYALRDRCFFEMVLQMGLRVSEMLSLTVGQVYQYGKVVAEISIERKHMKGGRCRSYRYKWSPNLPYIYGRLVRCKPLGGCYQCGSVSCSQLLV